MDVIGSFYPGTPNQIAEDRKMIEDEQKTINNCKKSMKKPKSKKKKKWYGSGPIEEKFRKKALPYWRGKVRNCLGKRVKSYMVSGIKPIFKTLTKKIGGRKRKHKKHKRR